MAERMPSYGGQAVIEGVMMRGARTVAIAMRAPDKQIVIHKEPLSGIYRSKVVKIPFLRGLVMLWDALGLGMRALTLSANTQTGEDEKLEGPALWGTIALSLVIAIGLFFLLPAAVGQVIEHWITGDLTTFAANPFGANASAGSAGATNAAAWWGNLMEGVFRLFLLVVYYSGRIGIRGVCYHAEHKTTPSLAPRRIIRRRSQSIHAELLCTLVLFRSCCSVCLVLLARRLISVFIHPCLAGWHSISAGQPTISGHRLCAG
jgi:uncharacterized protein YqhQ